MTYSDFENKYLIQDAIIRNIEIMGEATKNLANEFVNKNANVNWKDIARTRDKVIHFYFGVNLDIFWNIITIGTIMTH